MPNQQTFRLREKKGLVTIGISLPRDLGPGIKEIAALEKRSIVSQIAIIVEKEIDKDSRVNEKSNRKT